MSLRSSALARLAVYATLVVGLFPVMGRWLRSAMAGTDGVVRYLVDHLIQLAIVLVFVWVASKLERRPFGTYGLSRRPSMRAGFWKGAAAGFVLLSLLVFVLSALGALRLSMAPQRALVGAGFGLVYAAIFWLLALREEFLYRGYGLRTLAEAAGFGTAAVVTTIWFTATHMGPQENPLGLASVAVFGLIACLTLARTGSLWMAIGFHAAWNWGQTYFYGVADSGHAPAPGHLLAATVPSTAPAWLSGGAAGPEGSVLCLVLLVVVGLACIRFLPVVSRRPDASAAGSYPSSSTPSTSSSESIFPR